MEWIRLLLAVVARAVLCVGGGLVLCSLAPLLLGWQSNVVLTGSMEPLLRTGDVVAYQPMPASRVQPGQIMLARDPVHPGHLLSHRFVRRLADGQMVTRGDANGHDDSTPVPESAVIGVARLDIPRVGLPMVWWTQGNRGYVGVTVVGLFVAVLLASTRPRSGRGGRNEAEHSEASTTSTTPALLQP